MIKVIVAGSRNFSDYPLLERKLDFFLQHQPCEIVSGTARGADSLGEKYAILHGLPLKQFPAAWDTYGKSAGYRRNEQMAAYATHAVIFWDGESRGTKHMIDLAKKYSLALRVVRY